MNRSGPLDLGLGPPRKKLADPETKYGLHVFLLRPGAAAEEALPPRKRNTCTSCFFVGLEPPRKKPSARDDKDDTHTLKEAMRLTVSLTN